MAIQFCCSQCGQPIEVDDEHAGRTAGCPYCHHVVAVPLASTYQPDAAAQGRAVPGAAWPVSAAEAGGTPGAAPGAPQPTMQPFAASAEREREALKYGRGALTCTGIVVMLFLVMNCFGFLAGAKAGARAPNRQFTLPELLKEIQEMPGAPWLIAGQWGMVLCAVVGAVLAIVSLSRSRAGNWRGWVSLVVCGGMVLCVCGLSVILGVAMAAGGGMPGG